MAESINCSVQLQCYRKLYDANTIGGLEKSENIYTPNAYETQLSSVSNGISKKKDTKKCFQYYRYLVTLMEFFSLCQITCLRQATAVSIVAMVKYNKTIQANDSFNYSESTCPLNDQEIQMDTVPEIDGEFEWSPLTQGYIMSAGFLGYILTQMPGGMLADSFGAKYTITFGLFISSVCHFISPFMSRVNSNLMIFTQLVRGMGQGLLLASHSVVAANWFPVNERGFLNTLAMAGFAFGTLLGGVATGGMCSTKALGGWSFSYYFFGILGILLSFAFYFVFSDTPRLHPKISDDELEYIEFGRETNMSQKKPATPWKKMFCSPAVYAYIIGLYAVYWISTYPFTVYPTYLGTILHFPIKENSVFSSGPFLLQGIFSFMTSWFSNWIQKNEYAGVNILRKGFSLLCFCGYAVTFLGMYAAGCDRWLSVGMYTLQVTLHALCFGGILIVPTDMSPRFAGSLTGVATTISSTSGFIFPIVVGYLTNNEQSLTQWNKVFFLSSGISALGAISFFIFGSADVQPWNFETKEEYERYKTNLHIKNAKNEDILHPVDFISHL